MELKNSRLFRQQCFVNGEWKDAKSAKTFAVMNPTTGEQLGTAPLFSAEETAQAIEAARVAWLKWRTTTAAERAKILHRWHDAILGNR